MFKRNQIEEAIGQLLEPGPKELSSLLRSQIRRLLETDRRFGRSNRSTDLKRANFAFFSQAMPGRGGENRFSEYEAFALLTGLRLMRDRWPQGFAVTLLRRLRAELEEEYSRILRQDPAVLFNQQLVQQRAQPGGLAVDNTDPVFLCIISGNPRDTAPAAICQGQEALMAFHQSQSQGRTLYSIELATWAHLIGNALAQSEPRKRGRARR
jgi:hypothetical protein